MKNEKTKADEVLDANPHLKTAVQQIEKQFGEGAIMPLGAGHGARIEGISTGSLSLDMALGGQGIPCGRIVEIFGPESSGKTTLALHVVAQAQERGASPPSSMRSMPWTRPGRRSWGSSWKRCWSAAISGEEAMQIAEMLIKSNAVDVIVIDSVAALVPKQELQGEIGDAHVGLQARLMSQSMRKLTGRDFQEQDGGDLYQPDSREDRRHVRQSRDDAGWPGLEILYFVPHRRPPDRSVEGRRGGHRAAGAGQGGQEQGRPSLPRGRV